MWVSNIVFPSRLYTIIKTENGTAIVKTILQSLEIYKTNVLFFMIRYLIFLCPGSKIILNPKALR